LVVDMAKRDTVAGTEWAAQINRYLARVAPDGSPDR
jgi:hypothetical protein